MEMAADEIDRLRAALNEIVQRDVDGGVCRRIAVDALAVEAVEN
jgi:hypothetical protein